MRLLHTSDWHLGKRLFKLDRGPEHELFLNWLLATLIERQVDVLLIAGDVFDTPTPPHQALELFYNFLHRVSTETKTEVLLIAGNHDSGQLLEAPKHLLTHHRVKIWGKLSSTQADHTVRLMKGKEAIEICAIPFFRSYELLPQGEGDALAALAAYFPEKRELPQLLMLHHLAGMYEAAGSEQVISLSGVESIPSELLARFDYVALGHIHKPQKIGPKCFYSGSPLPLRFSETAPKSVVMIDLKDGQLTSELLPIPLSRALITLKAHEADWREKLKAIAVNTPMRPVVEVQLHLEAPRVGLIDELKAALEERGMDLLSYMPTFKGEENEKRSTAQLFELSPVDLFKEFYASKFPAAPEVPEDLLRDFTTLLQKVKDAPHTAQD